MMAPPSTDVMSFAQPPSEPDQDQGTPVAFANGVDPVVAVSAVVALVVVADSAVEEVAVDSVAEDLV